LEPWDTFETAERELLNATTPEAGDMDRYALEEQERLTDWAAENAYYEEVQEDYYAVTFNDGMKTLEVTIRVLAANEEQAVERAYAKVEQEFGIKIAEFYDEATVTRDPEHWERLFPEA
jgi:hypothetical protein